MKYNFIKNKYIINYGCEVNYPNTSAYALYVAKMCDALAEKKTNIN